MEEGTKIIFFNSLGVIVVTCFDKDSGKENVLEHYPGAYVVCSDKILIRGTDEMICPEFDPETLLMYKK